MASSRNGPSRIILCKINTIIIYFPKYLFYKNSLKLLTLNYIRYSYHIHLNFNCLSIRC